MTPEHPVLSGDQAHDVALLTAERNDHTWWNSYTPKQRATDRLASAKRHKAMERRTA